MDSGVSAYGVAGLIVIVAVGMTLLLTEELRAMRKALFDLVQRCRGDSRPACPILDDLEDRTGQ